MIVCKMAPSSSDYRGNVLLAAAIICTILSTLSFLGRLWGRSLSVVKLGWDDLLMAFAMVSRDIEGATPTRKAPLTETLGRLLVNYRGKHPRYVLRLEGENGAIANAAHQVYIMVLAATHNSWPPQTSRTTSS